MKPLSFLIIGAVFQLGSWLALAEEPIRVACVGDSITFGFGFGKDAKTYPMNLQDMLGAGYEVRNFGISSRTFLSTGAAPYIRSEQMTCALAFLPNIVVIILGTNDSKPRNFEKIDQLATDVPNLINAFRELPTHPTVFIGLPPPVFKTAFTINEENLAQIRERLKTIAAQEKAPVIDLSTTLLDQKKSFPDGVHPNRVGAQAIAKVVFDALQR